MTATGRPRPKRRQRVLFIGGLGRSGSTLIEKLLNELPTTVAVGETVHLWERGLHDRERCGCGEPFDRCTHWDDIGARAFGGWGQVDLDSAIHLRWRVDRTRRLPTIVKALRSGRATTDQQRYLDLLRPVLLAAGNRDEGPSVVVESSKHLSTAALLSLDPALDVRIVHLVRDPRGVAYSWTKHVTRPETEGEAMPIYRPSRTAARWVTDNLGFQALARLAPVLPLRYEDFLDAPARHLQRIGAFAGLRPEEIDLGFLDGRTAHLRQPMHSVAGNPLRFGGAEVTLRLDDAWRTSLTGRDRRIVTGLTLPLLGHYRYDIRVP